MVLLNLIFVTSGSGHKIVRYNIYNLLEIYRNYQKKALLTKILYDSHSKWRKRMKNNYNKLRKRELEGVEKMTKMKSKSDPILAPRHSQY